MKMRFVMKKMISLAFLAALVFAMAGSAHAAPTPQPPVPQQPSPDGPDTRGPIDPFPPPTADSY